MTIGMDTGMNTETVFKIAFEDLAKAGFQIKTEDPDTRDMPDPRDAQLACEGIMHSLFDAFSDTRLERNGTQIAWGMVNAFHAQARRLTRQLDDAERALRDMIRDNDTSEIGTYELEQQQDHCHALTEAREAIACCRDHMAALYAQNTGQAWLPRSGSRIASGRTASQISGQEYMKARRAQARDAHAPQGPLILFSGGQVWEDVDAIYRLLDAIKARKPDMVLGTTGQRKGCDAIAAIWAATNDIHLITFGLNHALGKRAGFARNSQMLKLKPAEVVVCTGSMIQKNLADGTRAAQLPLHVLNLSADVVAKMQTRTAQPKRRQRNRPAHTGHNAQACTQQPAKLEPLAPEDLDF